MRLLTHYHILFVVKKTYIYLQPKLIFMKNIILLLAVIVFVGCKKESSNIAYDASEASGQDYTFASNDNTPIDVEVDNPIMFQKVLGKWAYAHDTTRWFIVKEFGEGYAVIYFPRELQSPINRDIQVRYDMTVKGDTVDCVTPNIYPCCHFKVDGSSGYAVEYLKQDGQNDYVPVIKL